MKRRGFLATLPVLGFLERVRAERFPSASGEKIPVGLQLYSLQDQLTAPDADVLQILKELAAIGVQELETASGDQGFYYGYRSGELARIIEDLGMRWIGAHITGIPREEKLSSSKANRRNLRDHLPQILDELAEARCEWVVCAGSAVGTPDEIKATTELFVRTAEEAGKMHIRFAYHNHKREFERVGDTTAFEYIMNNTKPSEIYMQLDLGWAVMAGVDPVDLFRQYPHRFPLWHVKDFSGVNNKPCVVGKGILDFKRIYRYADISGVKHAFIEQDNAKSSREIAEGIGWLNREV